MATRLRCNWAMTMIKLPNLELKEVELIVEALDHYRGTLSATQCGDKPEYARLVELLKRRARIPLE